MPGMICVAMDASTRTAGLRFAAAGRLSARMVAGRTRRLIAKQHDFLKKSDGIQKLHIYYGLILCEIVWMASGGLYLVES